ncbi:MAG: hypothetical protein KAJ52_05850 [Sedimentisphaerales bacterium]|nr:hypothetical protein [Sedimentisphaerales bacterium]
MASINANNTAEQLPGGYEAIAVSAQQKEAPLQIAVVVKIEPDPVAGHFVVLRDTIDAKILLGCVIDAERQVHQWLELWIQSIENIGQTTAATQQTLTNAILDERWRRQCRAFEQIDSAEIIKTGWESAHPQPTYIDLSGLEAIHPSDPDSGHPWQLCQDDALLIAKELPGYSNSPHRYLYQPELGPDSPFIPVTGQAPTNEHTEDMSATNCSADHILPLNPEGGFILVRGCGLIAFESFVDVLGGASWEGIRHGRGEFAPGITPKLLSVTNTDSVTVGRLFQESQGRWGSLAESFYLKLSILSDMVSSVRTMVYHQQRPLLNLSTESFQIKLGEPGTHLPFLWTSQAVLIDAGDVVAMPIQTSDAEYYVPASLAGTSVYRPVSVGLASRGRGTVRIRQVLPDKSDKIILEGTFTTQQRAEAGPNDLVWLRLNLACGRLDLYAHLEEKTALAAGELRFRTIGQQLNNEQVSSLREAEGVPIPEALFEIVTLLSTPCDLYSLGVLAVRLLLVDKQTTLPVALDEMLSLARQVALEYDETQSLEDRIQRIFDADQRWGESLGAHRLIMEEVAPEDAYTVLPSDLWIRTLAMIVRMFAGIGPDSVCRDYGDAPAGGLHKVFDQSVTDLDELIPRARSLIVADCKFNREINNIIQKYMVGSG